jgi:hypothetical protein
MDIDIYDGKDVLKGMSTIAEIIINYYYLLL